jgi:hypothetical protein
MKKVSVKQSKINRELHKVYKELEDERPRYCSGCGRSDVPLSHSHIISRARRPDLITDKANITYHCLSMGDNRRGCHELWEGGLLDKQKLLDFHKCMEYILEKDTELYFLLTE